MGDVFRIILATALVNNLILGQLLGVSSLFYTTDKQSKRLQQTSEVALATAIVMVLSGSISLIIDRYLLQAFALEAMRLITFVVVASIVSLNLSALITRYFPLTALRAQLEFFLIAGNSAVIGASLILVRQDLSALHYLAYNVGTALGFGALLMVFAALRDRLQLAPVPIAFRGVPIELFLAGIVAMSLLGFEGLV